MLNNVIELNTTSPLSRGEISTERPSNLDRKITKMNFKTPWQGIGVDTKGCMTLEQVLNTANLNFKVEPKPIYVFDNNAMQYNNVDKFTANVRSDNNTVLGVVGERYNILQNEEAFDFLDGMVAEGMKFTAANVTKDSKRTWILGEFADRNILGDEITPYVYFENSFDGSSSVRLAIVTLRKVCNNGLTMVLGNNDFTWSIRHTNNARNKLDIIHNNILRIDNYMDEYEKEMDVLQQKTVDIREFLDYIIPMDNVQTERKEQNLLYLRDSIQSLYERKDDIQKFKGTQYGALLALTDFNTHGEPIRITKNYEERRFLDMTKGNKLVNKAIEYFKAV